jgi:hypothetical protein
VGREKFLICFSLATGSVASYRRDDTKAMNYGWEFLLLEDGTFCWGPGSVMVFLGWPIFTPSLVFSSGTLTLRILL